MDWIQHIADAKVILGFGWLSLLPAVGGLLSGGAGKESTQTQEYESTTKGTSSIDRNELDATTLKALSSLFSGGQLQANQASVQGALGETLKSTVEDQQNPFDIKGFVSGIMKAANNTANNDLAKGIATTESSIGGTQGNNSMAALLSNKLRTDTAAQLAGVKSEAVAKGTEIANQGKQLATESVVGITGAMTKNLTDMLSIFRGSQTNQKQKTKETTKGTGTSQTSEPFNWAAGLGSALGSFKMPT